MEYLLCNADAREGVGGVAAHTVSTGGGARRDDGDGRRTRRMRR